jgi:hypothetical protein
VVSEEKIMNGGLKIQLKLREIWIVRYTRIKVELIRVGTEGGLGWGGGKKCELEINKDIYIFEVLVN